MLQHGRGDFGAARPVAPPLPRVGLIFIQMAGMSPQRAQLQQACSGVSREMVRRVLAGQKGKSVDCIGRGPGAKWKKR